MPTIRAAKSAFRQARRWAASGLFRLASCVLRCCINRYERSTISPIVLRVALFVVRLLERLAAVLAFGHRPHDDHKDPGRSNRR
jgi:hypothetical protein